MNIINNGLYKDLLTIIETNKTYIKDIWIYGNQSFKNNSDQRTTNWGR